MSILDAVQESDISAGKSEWKPLENFALQVVGYGQDEKGRGAIEGIRLDTGEEMIVVLHPYKSTKPLLGPRPEVKDFVAKEGEISTLLKSLPTDEVRKQVLQGIKAKTEPGGIIIVQGAYTEENGTVNARWLKSASKYRGHSQVFPNVMLRVNPIKDKKREDGQIYASASAMALFPKRSQRIHTAEELSSALEMAFKGADDIKGQPVVLVRLAHESETRAFEFRLSGYKDPTTKEYTFDTPEQATACVLEMEVSKKIVELAEKNKDLLVEVIPGMRISLGPQTKASLEKNERGLEQINRSYRLSKESDKETGFTESYLVLHTTKGGWHVFSAAGPLSNKPFVFHASDIYTPNFIAGHPIATFEDQEQPHPNEPSLEVADVSEEDMGFEIDDVVNEQLSAEMAPSQMSQPAPRMRMS